MSVAKMMVDAREITRKNVNAVFEKQRPDVAARWLHAVLAQAAATGSNYMGHTETARMLYGLFEACESNTPPPAFPGEKGKRAELTPRERASRWWAYHGEAFCAGGVVVAVFLSLMHWWASSV